MDLVEFLTQCVDEHGDRVAMRFAPDSGPPTTLTCPQLLSAAASVSAKLQGAGVRPGSRVIIACGNTPGFAASLFGVVMAGSVGAPVHPSLPRAALRALSEEVGAAAALVPGGRAGDCSELTLRHGVLEVDRGSDGRAEKVTRLQHVSDAEVACCVFSSCDGKAVLLSHRNLIAAVESIIQALAGEPPPRRVLCPLPFDGIYGLVPALLVSLRLGAELVTGFEFTSDRALGLIQEHRVDTVLGVPWHYSELLGFERRKEYDTSSVVRWMSGGGPLFEPVMHDFEAAYGARLRSAFGVTETAGLLTLNPPRRRIGSEGKPVPGLAVRIHDEDARPLVNGVIGEIAAKGPSVMHGYADHRLTDEVMKRGWLHTGDMGYRDADGYIYLTGRRENYFVSRGVGVYAREIEEVIIAMTGVRDVCVLGRPAGAEEQAPHAYVVLRPWASLSAAQVQDACRERFSPPKVPQTVTFLDSLPYTLRGKIDRALLAAMA
jgi:long-chain acyl-CoA synthetase